MKLVMELLPTLAVVALLVVALEDLAVALEGVEDMDLLVQDMVVHPLQQLLLVLNSTLVMLVKLSLFYDGDRLMANSSDIY